MIEVVDCRDCPADDSYWCDPCCMNEDVDKDNENAKSLTRKVLTKTEKLVVAKKVE